MQRQTEITVKGQTIRISVLSHADVLTPFNPRQSDDFVTKYLLEFYNTGTGKSIEMEYYTSIRDCNYRQRRFVENVNAFLWCGGDPKKRADLRASLSRIVRRVDGLTDQKTRESLSSFNTTQVFQLVKGDRVKHKSEIYDSRDLAKLLLSDPAVFGKTNEDAPNFAALAGDPERVEKKMIDENGLKFAFRCFIDDAISGTYDLDAFQEEFGYEKASECIRVWRACQSQLSKAAAIGFPEPDLYEVINELSVMGIE